MVHIYLYIIHIHIKRWYYLCGISYTTEFLGILTVYNREMSLSYITFNFD